MSFKSRLFIISVTLTIFVHAAESGNKENRPLKWGIVAAGKISQDFANALSAFSSDHHVVAIATRKDLQRAEAFATKFGIPKAYAGYERLAADPNVEVVYIGNINPQHFHTAKLMLESGKNVLMEKPLALTRRQTEILTRLARAKNVFFAEGLWSRYLPSYQFIRKQIREGKLGKVVSVDAELGSVRPDPRFVLKELGGGVLLDSGSYGIDVMEWIFEEEPRSIKATAQLNDDGVDTNVQAQFMYSGNRKATLKLSITEKLKNTIKIHGTKASMEVPDFWFSTSVVDVEGKKHDWPLPTGAKYPFINSNRAGLAYQAEEVRKYIRAGKEQSDVAPHKVSVGIANVQDKIRKQIGVVYINDCDVAYVTPNLALPPKQEDC